MEPEVQIARLTTSRLVCARRTRPQASSGRYALHHMMTLAADYPSLTSGTHWQVALVDWRPWFTQDSSRISFQGQDVGRKLGRELAATAPSLRSLHVVGTSAGAWPANECITAYVDAAPATRASTILSLTDPFTARADQGPNLNDGWGFRWRTTHLHCPAPPPPAFPASSCTLRPQAPAYSRAQQLRRVCRLRRALPQLRRHCTVHLLAAAKLLLL